MKNKSEKILGGFLERNKDYAVELYISNGITSSLIGKIFIPTDRIYNADDKKFTLEWDKDKNSDVRYNKFSFSYEEILACYKEIDKDGNLKTSETVIVVLKNGINIYFECVGQVL